MRASLKGRVSTMAAGLLLAASVGLASANRVDGAEAPTPAETPGAADASAYQRGMHLFFAEQYEQVLPFFVRVKDEARSRAGPDSREHATALNDLGELYRRMERFDEAEPLFREAIAIDEARLGPDHQSLAKPLNNLALVQRARGDYVEAERNQKRSLHILEDTVGRRHPDVAGSLNNLARLYESTGFPERAQPLLERAWTIARGTLGEAHPTTKRIAINLERVTATLAGATPDLDLRADAREIAAEPVLASLPDPPAARAEPLPPPTPLRLPPPADLPDPAAGPAALEPPVTASATSPADFVAGLETTTPPKPLASPETALPSDPLIGPEPMVVEPAPMPENPRTEDRVPEDDVAALVVMEEPANGVAVAAEAIEPAAAPSDVTGAGNVIGEAVFLPQVRPAGLRWPRLPSGAYAMHLASVRSPVSATEEWHRLAGLLGLPEVVHQLEPQRIEREEEGVFYRVLGGPFITSEEAATACAPVRAKGEYCGILADGD